MNMIPFLLTDEFIEGCENIYTDVLVLCFRNADGKCIDE